jgi:NitT/TauT family transport system substrate-binding protein
VRKLYKACLAIMALLPLLGVPAGAAELERVRVSIIPINDVTPLFAAMQFRYFEQEGLVIDTTPSAGGATGVPGLLAGSFDIAYSNVVSTLLAAQQGIQLRVIAPGTKVESVETDVAAMVVRRDSGIRTGHDLEGKSIGVNTRNNVIWLYARAWVRATGGNPERVTFREIPHPQMEDALRQKQVDAGFMVAPYVSMALAGNEFAEIAHPYSDVQPGVDVGQYVTTAQTLQSRPETVARFNRALQRGITWYNAHLGSPEMLKIVAGFTRIDENILRTIAYRPAPNRVDPVQMTRTMQLMIENRMLRTPVDVPALVAPGAS